MKKKIVVEHFTNTRCIICASRNPGFYNALSQRQDIIHIAYHPSSPYSNCLFNTQNRGENDARTRHYDLYGGTPSYTVNGEFKTSAQVQSSTVYNEFDNQVSPLKISMAMALFSADSIRLQIDISAVANHNFNTLTLYAPMIEDSVFYDAPNGEKIHHDVFRKSFTGESTLSFKMPKLGEPSFKFSKSIAKNAIWMLPRLSAVAIIADVDKKTLQVEQSALLNMSTTSSLDFDREELFFTLYPNPVSSIISVILKEKTIENNFSIYNHLGQVIANGDIKGIETTVDVSGLANGLYILKIGKFSQKFLKQ